MSGNNHYHGYELFNVLLKHRVGFAEGNVIKYVFRWKEKDGIADLLKAKDYLDRLITCEQERLISTTYDSKTIQTPRISVP